MRVLAYLLRAAKVAAPLFGAAALGLLMAGIVLAVEKLMMRNRPVERAA